MLNYIPRNWGWYVAAWILFGPYVLIALMEDDVLARVIGLGFIPVGVTLALLWAVVSIDYDWLQPTKWLEKKIKNISKTKIFIFGKIILLMIFVIFLPITWDYLKDLSIFRQDKVPSVITSISDIRTGTGALSVVLTVNTEPHRLDAYYFPRNTFEEGYTYKFWYLPNTKRVIKTELISTNQPE